ncbi:MAG: class I SAM-dependent DNA methyltransferase [Senegalia sp. (in: firmicutes)]|uniref:class I SAM-dependent DNA methyltransferase n=1 Tax=Senegalia sp. (in: firmicutes) TaxID=1924098 RepID=UPI003F9561AA
MVYNRFAEIYDRLMTKDIDYDEWYNYIEDLFKRIDKKPKDILEMACGTGNLTEILAKNRYDVECFDLSEEMLVIAYEKLRKYKNVSIRNMNMIDFKFNKKFDSVISICDSINYIINMKDLEKTFLNVFNHLKDGGIFIFDINSYYKLSEVIGNNTFIYDEEDVFYTWENEFEDDICNFYLTFFLKEKDIYHRFNEVHKERAFHIEEIMLLLKKVGFKEISSFDGLSFKKPSKKSTRINFLAIK